MTTMTLTAQPTRRGRFGRFERAEHEPNIG
jgi:hypothetical protein